jgi:hypothetical protein
MDRAHVGSGTVAVAVGLLVECNPVAGPAFSQLSTFMWLATIVAGITVRVDTLGVTSIVRALNLRPKLYRRLLAHFRSTGVNFLSGAGGVAAVPRSRARQRAAGPGRARHQDCHARQEDAGRLKIGIAILERL